MTVVRRARGQGTSRAAGATTRFLPAARLPCRRDRRQADERRRRAGRLPGPGPDSGGTMRSRFGIATKLGTLTAAGGPARRRPPTARRRSRSPRTIRQGRRGRQARRGVCRHSASPPAPRRVRADGPVWSSLAKARYFTGVSKGVEAGKQHLQQVGRQQAGGGHGRFERGQQGGQPRARSGSGAWKSQGVARRARPRTSSGRRRLAASASSPPMQ